MHPQRRKESCKAVSECRGLTTLTSYKKMTDLPQESIIPAFPSHLQSRRIIERMGHLNTTKLNHVETQDCLSWYPGLVQIPVWQRSLNTTQRLPVMGLATRESTMRQKPLINVDVTPRRKPLNTKRKRVHIPLWISQDIRRGNTVESQKLRESGTVLDAPDSQL